MTLFHTFTVYFLLILTTSSVYAEPENKLIDYLSLNDDISLIYKKAEEQETVLDENMSLAISYFLNETTNKTTPDLNVLEVEATAYTSHIAQTDNTPTIAAWGDRLKTTTKAIAVSHDLLKKYGLKYRTKVRIKGLSGEFLVLDKMHKRWKKKIDIYMGMNRKAAFKWGKRKVLLSWVKESV